MGENILFMTVGTGQKGKERSLAHGLLTSIEDLNLKKIIFITTNKSEKTVEIIKEMYYEENNSKLDDYELVTISNPDDFNECYNKINTKLKDYMNNNVIFDYTSGTKTMAVTAVLIAILNHKKLRFVSGTRGEDGVILSKTEEPKKQNPYMIYDKINLDKVKQLFNHNKFQTAKQVLSEVILLNDNIKETYIQFLDAYDKWDKFQHEKISKDLLSVDITGIKKQTQLNQNAISIINNKTKEQRCYYILADLINNARRRYNETKYDDAIARLYRALELIEQIQLNKYNIKTSDVNIEKLKEKKVRQDYINRLENIKNNQDNNKIKIGVREGYQLLKELKDDIGKYYIVGHREEYKQVLDSRNDSILAHGQTSQTKEDYEKFEELVLKIAEKQTKDIKRYIKETKFPVFNIEE